MLRIEVLLIGTQFSNLYSAQFTTLYTACSAASATKSVKVPKQIYYRRKTDLIQTQKRRIPRIPVATSVAQMKAV